MGIKDSALFRRWAKKAFDEIDVDKTGHIDYKEVCIGILKIYDSLNAKFPAHVLAPKRQEIWDLCKKYDKDESGSIDFEEFVEMAKVLIGSRTNFTESLPWKYGSVLVLKVVICPLAALGLVKLLTHVQAPYAEKLPVAPLASIIEMGLKFASRAS